MKLKNLKILSQQINNKCNMDRIHYKCPLNSIDIYANLPHDIPMSDEVILNNIEISYANGFAGMLEWHFYNEPMLALDRIESLIPKIKEIKSDADIRLWTNGMLIDEDNCNRLAAFTGIKISNYTQRDYGWLKVQVPQIWVMYGNLDNRLNCLPGNNNGCHRFNKELIIDYYGNWRLCCADFVGGAVSMNVQTDGFQAIVDEYDRIKPAIRSNPQGDDVPEICHSCRMR